jgi:hypothetical protein
MRYVKEGKQGEHSELPIRLLRSTRYNVAEVHNRLTALNDQLTHRFPLLLNGQVNIQLTI